MIRRSTQQENIAILNVYGPNTRWPRYIEQILLDLKWEIDSNTVTAGAFKPHTDDPDRKPTKIDHSWTILMADGPNIYRTFHPITTKYTFWSPAHGTFSRLNHVSGYR